MMQKRPICWKCVSLIASGTCYLLYIACLPHSHSQNLDGGSEKIKLIFDHLKLCLPAITHGVPVLALFNTTEAFDPSKKVDLCPEGSLFVASLQNPPRQLCFNCAPMCGCPC